MWNEFADLIRFHARNTASDHACTGNLFFASDATSDAVRHGVRLLSANRERHATGLVLHDSAARLHGDSSSALLGHLTADLIRNALCDLFTYHATRANGDLLDDLLRNDATDLDWNLGDDGLGHLTAHGDRDRLPTDLRLIGRAGDLALDDVRAPLGTERVEAAWLHCPA